MKAMSKWGWYLCGPYFSKFEGRGKQIEGPPSFLGWTCDKFLEELKTILKIALLLFSKTMLRGPDQYVRWLIRREAHTRFGAFLSTGMNARPAPLTDMRVFVLCFPSDGSIMPVHRFICRWEDIVFRLTSDYWRHFFSQIQWLIFVRISFFTQICSKIKREKF